MNSIQSNFDNQSSFVRAMFSTLFSSFSSPLYCESAAAQELPEANEVEKGSGGEKVEEEGEVAPVAEEEEEEEEPEDVS